MLYCFKPVNGKIEQLSMEKIVRGCWIDATDPTDDEIIFLSQITKIPEEDLKMPLDEEERPRIEEADDFTMIVYRAPFVHKEEEEIEISTAPVGIFLTAKYVITIHLHHTKYLEYLVERGKNENVLSSLSFFVIRVLNEITKRYFNIIRRIEKDVDEIENAISEGSGTVGIDRIINTRKILIYFHRALIANRAVVIIGIETGIRFIDRKYTEKFKDLHTETIQLIEMSGTYRDILAGSLDAYYYRASDAANQSVKILTVITAILSVPALIIGLYGMNVKLPFENHPFAFGIILIMSLVSSWITYLIFNRKKWI